MEEMAFLLNKAEVQHNDLECLWMSTKGLKAKQYTHPGKHNEQSDQKTKIFHTHVQRDEGKIYISITYSFITIAIYNQINR